MKQLLTREKLCEWLCITYPTLNRMMNDGRFNVQPVNGRGKKLLFDPDAVEAWIKSRQQPVTPVVPSSAQQRRRDKSFQRRQANAAAVLAQHDSNRKKGDAQEATK